MVDPEAYRNNNGNSFLYEPYVTAAYFITEHETLSDEQLLISAHWITGFSLAQKSWGQFSVSSLEDVVWNDQAFKKLVIDEDRRILIHALVKSHRHDEASFDDIVQNKGKGLVGLLSGSPGVGKTLTAEAVAEVTCRPLYQVSTGELGIEPDKVDNRLNVILDISRRWGCVLLIDEADVFLATRGTDLARDTLVSIFLRRLEYFVSTIPCLAWASSKFSFTKASLTASQRGVLILTTNRKSEIDSAFQSQSPPVLGSLDISIAQHSRTYRSNPFLPSLSGPFGRQPYNRLAKFPRQRSEDEREHHGHQSRYSETCKGAFERSTGI